MGKQGQEQVIDLGACGNVRHEKKDVVALLICVKPKGHTSYHATACTNYWWGCKVCSEPVASVLDGSRWCCKCGAKQ